MTAQALHEISKAGFYTNKNAITLRRGPRTTTRFISYSHGVDASRRSRASGETDVQTSRDGCVSRQDTNPERGTSNRERQSLLSQRNQRIDVRGAARRYPRGEEGHHDEQRHHDHIRAEVD
jgi:hypothetical protein